MKTFVDPSAIVAVMMDEPDAGIYLNGLHANECVMSVVGKIETALSIGKLIRDYRLASELVDHFCRDAGVSIVGVAPEIYDDVLLAYARYGKGTGHPARLNFGDCFSYAFAKRMDLPLIFKGNDFSQTDTVPAI